MNKLRLTAIAICFCGATQAQESDFGVSVGLKAWNTQWTTFGYFPTPPPPGVTAEVLKQVPAKDKVVLLPLLSVRYSNFVATLSGYGSTQYHFLDGPGDTRKEFDVNLGYLVAPGVAATLGYKKVGQRNGPNNYELAGPVAGLSATLPLRGALSAYGLFGLGRLKPTGASTVDLDADYRLTELGLVYGVAFDGMPRALAFTIGYRTQVFSSKNALDAQPGQDGRDLTQGLTLGLIATF